MQSFRPILRKHRGYAGARLEQMKKAASLMLEGATIPEIAKSLNVSQSTVRRLLKASKGLPTRYLSESAQVARLMELERLDKLGADFFPVAIGMGKGVPFSEALSATRIVLNIMNQRMKLLSYDDTPPPNSRKIKAFVDTLSPGM
jgi:methylphosphotriester-DNA--protein-cysteine methyltransferase